MSEPRCRRCQLPVSFLLIFGQFPHDDDDGDDRVRDDRDDDELLLRWLVANTYGWDFHHGDDDDDGGGRANVLLRTVGWPVSST